MSRTPRLVPVLAIAVLVLSGCTVNVTQPSAPPKAAASAPSQTPTPTPTATAADADAAFDAALHTGVDALDASAYVDFTQIAQYRVVAREMCQKLDDGVSVDDMINATQKGDNTTKILGILEITAATGPGSYCHGYEPEVAAYSDSNG